MLWLSWGETKMSGWQFWRRYALLLIVKSKTSSKFVNHYDEDGKLIGYSLPGVFGGMDHYNSDGTSAGYSIEGVFGGMDHYDDEGHHAGYSIDGVIGGATHYDSAGNNVGYSSPNLIAGSTFHGFDSKSHSDIFDTDQDDWADQGDCFDSFDDE